MKKSSFYGKGLFLRATAATVVLAIAILSVRVFLHLSVCHTGASVKNGAN